MSNRDEYRRIRAAMEAAQRMPIVPTYIPAPREVTPVPPAGLRPLRGNIQHVSRIPDGERWPVLTFRVVGEHPAYSRHGALLTLDGQWRWFEGHAHLVPDECNLSQGQLGDALAAACIAPGLPFQEPDRFRVSPIEYVEVVERPANAVVEEWKPKAPKWRGGRPWR